MTSVIGVRELARNIDSLSAYDYVEIEDKKTHRLKGLFISPKYAHELKAFLDAKINESKQAQMNELSKFVGILDGDTKNLDYKAIKALKNEKYSK